jgi:hypothetical protein
MSEADRDASLGPEPEISTRVEQIVDLRSIKSHGNIIDLLAGIFDFACGRLSRTGEQT